MILHKQVIGLAAEAASLAAPASIRAADASTGQEDFQAHTILAARQLEQILADLELALAYELVTLRQAHDLAGRALLAPLQGVLAAVAEVVPRDPRGPLAGPRRRAGARADRAGHARARGAAVVTAARVRQMQNVAMTVLANARLIDGTGAPAVEPRDRADRATAGSPRSRQRRRRAAPPDGRDRPRRPHAAPGPDRRPRPRLQRPQPQSRASARPRRCKGELPRPRELGYFILAKAASAMLAAGITSVRDVGAYDDEAIVLREAVRLGIVEGPRILSCGRIISATAPGGAIFTTMYREADGPDDMRKAVREQLRRGADFVKLMATGARSVLAENPEPAQMTAEELQRDRRRGPSAGGPGRRPRRGPRRRAARRAAGRRHGRARPVAAPRAGAARGRWRRSGIVLVPTLTHVPRSRRPLHRRTSPRRWWSRPSASARRLTSTLVAARDAGVTLAMGHDSGPPGDNAIELVRMVAGRAVGA